MSREVERKNEIHPLINEIRKAIKKRLLNFYFTAKDIKKLIESEDIRRSNGEKYSSNYHATILSQYDINTADRNVKKCLMSKKEPEKLKTYHFIDIPLG